MFHPSPLSLPILLLPFFVPLLMFLFSSRGGSGVGTNIGMVLSIVTLSGKDLSGKGLSGLIVSSAWLPLVSPRSQQRLKTKRKHTSPRQ